MALLVMLKNRTFWMWVVVVLTIFSIWFFPEWNEHNMKLMLPVIYFILGWIGHGKLLRVVGDSVCFGSFWWTTVYSPFNPYLNAVIGGAVFLPIWGIWCWLSRKYSLA